MKKYSKYLRWLEVLFLLAVSGCATISGSSMQSVSIQTIQNNTEVAGVGCTLANDAGKWFVTSPGSVTIHKSTADLNVDCKTVTNSSVGHETIVSKATGSAWGNIVAGGLIGYAVDRNTGAAFDYPSVITVAIHKAGEEAGIVQPVQQGDSQLDKIIATTQSPITSAPPNKTNGTSPQKSLTEKLRELQISRDDGTITENEYKSKKKQLLDNL